MAVVLATETDLYQSQSVKKGVTDCWSRSLSVGIVAQHCFGK